MCCNQPGSFPRGLQRAAEGVCKRLESVFLKTLKRLSGRFPHQERKRPRPERRGQFLNVDPDGIRRWCLLRRQLPALVVVRSCGLPISSNSSAISNSARASSSAASSWIDLPDACSSASSCERATFSLDLNFDFGVQDHGAAVQAQFLDRGWPGRPVSCRPRSRLRWRRRRRHAG